MENPSKEPCLYFSPEPKEGWGLRNSLPQKESSIFNILKFEGAPQKSYYAHFSSSVMLQTDEPFLQHWKKPSLLVLLFHSSAKWKQPVGLHQKCCNVCVWPWMLAWLSVGVFDCRNHGECSLHDALILWAPLLSSMNKGHPTVTKESHGHIPCKPLEIWGNWYMREGGGGYKGYS